LLTGASGDISRCITFGRQCDCSVNVYFQAKAGIIPVLDKNTKTLDALGSDLLVPSAAVRRRRFRIAPDKGQARRQPDELVRALRPVGRQVRAPMADQAQQGHNQKQQV